MSFFPFKSHLLKAIKHAGLFQAENSQLIDNPWALSAQKMAFLAAKSGLFDRDSSLIGGVVFFYLIDNHH